MWVAWGVALAAVFLLAACYAKVLRYEVQLSFAEEQTDLFEQLRRDASRESPVEAAGHLEYALEYYPSGTKQEAGSKLDSIVERARRNAVREMIADLKRKTGEDHGEDPRAWIEAFAAR